MLLRRRQSCQTGSRPKPRRPIPNENRPGLSPQAGPCIGTGRLRPGPRKVRLVWPGPGAAQALTPLSPPPIFSPLGPGLAFIAYPKKP